MVMVEVSMHIKQQENMTVLQFFEGDNDYFDLLLPGFCLESIILDLVIEQNRVKTDVCKAQCESVR